MANSLRWGLGIDPVTLPDGQIGSVYPTTTLSATGGTSPFSWSATGLPNGMSLSSAGVLTGTPIQHGSFSMQVTVTDSSVTPLTRNVTLPLTINPAPLVLSTTSLAPATIGTPYTQTIAATGGVAPYNWSATGLPADLTINPTTGTISGTPTAAGTSQVTVTVTDDAGQVKSAQFTIVVDPLDLTVTTQTLPDGQVGQAYIASIVVAGGVPPYSFTLTGDLPEGLTLNPTTGAITGTPTKAQTSTFSVTIEDSTLLPQSAMAKAAVHSVTQSFSITVAAVPVVVAPTPVPTLNDWGLLLLSALTIGAAGFFTRKRTTE
ncbi:MAG: Ig domain-containing protein [Burkholderiaceae bacterium]|nr:Ig domain-containing protein [Burkholderiaceae bacterium]